MLTWLKIAINNWKLMAIAGTIISVLFLGGLVWYYKSDRDLKAEKVISLTEDNDKLFAVVKNQEAETNKAISALTKDRERAASREATIKKNQIKAFHEEHSNDNINPDYGVLLVELWDAEQAANDNKSIHQAPR